MSEARKRHQATVARLLREPGINAAVHAPMSPKHRKSTFKAYMPDDDVTDIAADAMQLVVNASGVRSLVLRKVGK